ncbi:alpha/beta hydrolase family protein [Polaribacter porphyrae]|uniref:BD-FAE-like domain-containing protein n=1 Tax=Polaribacter porphyrae TaxID=1137780 RepID=A0A2S7WJB8_9FLAO|nr:alpha/beta hydrolase [Polaribacter porphyrae]PQJ77709.1 hypothetical protein BTO18_00260 [Polaribacter porphyrae]
MKVIYYVFCIIFFCNCSSSDEIFKESTTNIEFLENETILYKQNAVNGNLTSLDIYTVPNSKVVKPIVIWVHGGAWVTGDKANDMQRKAPFFNNLGYVFISINYRLSPFPYEVNNNARIKHPAHIIDIADALQWIYNNIEKYGGDTSNIVLLGHSAGAHLVALAGVNQQLFLDRDINFKNIKGVISLDTQAYNVPYAINNLTQQELYVNAFSDDKTLQKNASPYHQLDNFGNTVPNWLFASRGTTVRKEILNAFVEKLQSKNGISEIVAMDGYSHEDINDLIADTSNTILSRKISVFLEKVFN